VVEIEIFTLILIISFEGFIPCLSVVT